MRAALLVVFLACWSFALAQDADSEQPSEPPSEQVGEQQQESDEPTGGDENEAPGQLAEETGAEAGEEAAEEYDPFAEDEFKPGEEISEDYPVPLPSDI